MAVAAALGVAVVEGLEVAVVVAALEEEEEEVEDADSEVCSFFLVLFRWIFVLTSE